MKEVQIKTQDVSKADLFKKFKANTNFELTTGSFSSTYSRNEGYYYSKDSIEENNQPHIPFFTEKALIDMALKKIPDFEELYHSLSDILISNKGVSSALDFLPAMYQFSLTDRVEIDNFLKNPETNHVLVNNEQLKIVLIRWEPGALCKIHGHAIGGCVFKVLSGKIIEKRFSADSEQRLLSEGTYHTGHIAYIDDMMGLHCVGNPYSEPAITLHMYTPGNYKPKTYSKTK